MTLYHDPQDGDRQELATTVETADSLVSQTRGLMFKQDLPDDYALVMDFEKSKIRGVHTVFVFEPIDVVWLAENTVVQVKRLNPFRGIGFATADEIIELPAGAASNINPGDEITYDG